MTLKRGEYYYVYILGSHSGTLYIGVTNNLLRRVFEHRNHLRAGFTANYDVTRLLYYERFTDVRDAIAREKQLKGWTRAKKIALLEKANPHWIDLGREWSTRHQYEPEAEQGSERRPILPPQAKER